MTQDKEIIWLIEPQLWSNWDQQAAAEEGWLIVCSPNPGVACIVRLSHAQRASLGTGVVRPFTSDLQAAEFVMERMHQGSTFHESAWRALLKCQMHGEKG